MKYIRETEKKQNVHPRTLWANEEYDFSPFVVEHINEISELTGMDLEVIETEAKVGPFELDILCKDNNTDRYVIIENQIEQSDHDHLGKCLTYMTNLKAFTCIWINKSFRPEHLKAIESLNDMTTGDYNFFGINIKTYQYNDGELSYDWQVIVEPSNSFIKLYNTSKTITAIGNRYKEFWTKMINSLPDNLVNSFNVSDRNTVATTKLTKNTEYAHKIVLSLKPNNLIGIGIQNYRFRTTIGPEELHNLFTNNSKYNDWQCEYEGKKNQDKFMTYIHLEQGDTDEETINKFIDVLNDIQNVLSKT